MSDPTEVERLVAHGVKQLGRLDCTVANAGICHIQSLLTSTPHARRQTLAVNVEGVMNTAIAAAKQMIKQGEGGRVINAASVAAYEPGTGHGVYS